MAKALHAGGEVDAWCTKCKLVLNHRIIAMIGPKPARVECSTCNSHHNYRGTAPGEKAASGGGAAGGAAPRRAIGVTRGPTRAVQAAMDREKTWEKAVSGKMVSEFKQYRVSHMFEEGDLLRHVKFGDGVVLRVIEQKKIEVMFKDESRVLAQGLSD